MKLTPTAEQQNIIDFARNESANLTVVARAGAAKSTTLRLIAEALPDKKIVCVAFNKAIAEEMKASLPPNAEALTLHKMGKDAWQSFAGWCKIDKDKTFNLVRDQILRLSKPDRDELSANYSDLRKMYTTAKSAGYLPGSYKGHWKPLITDPDTFYGELPMKVSALQRSVIDEVLVKSFKMALDKVIDFDDMIYCPAICSTSWPKADIYMVDEAQDLSALNHHILKKMVRQKRVIVVGDPYQAIYGFRGADTKSMEKLTTMFEMVTMHLTVSFRCSYSVIEEARKRVGDIQPREDAPVGIVDSPKVWSIDDLSPTDAVICRNNAPLFSLAFKMFAEGKPAKLAGRDMLIPIMKLLKGLGKENELCSVAMNTFIAKRQAAIERAKEKNREEVADQYDCIKLLLTELNTLGDVRRYVEKLIEAPGRIFLSTGHKAKGLEFDRVFFLDPQLCKDNEQDKNLRYVICTRARNELYYVKTGGLTGGAASKSS